MRFLVRAFLLLLFVALVGAAGAYLYAGRMAGPVIAIARPDKFVGAATPLGGLDGMLLEGELKNLR